MSCWHAALRMVLRQWKDWVVIASVLAGCAGIAVLWLAAPLATGIHVALHVAFLLWGLGFLWYALWLARRRFAPEGIRLGRLISQAQLWSALGMAATAGLALPWGLVHWVPGFSSLPAQLASALLRFFLAWALLSGSVCWLAACLGILSKEPR